MIWYLTVMDIIANLYLITAIQFKERVNMSHIGKLIFKTFNIGVFTFLTSFSAFSAMVNPEKSSIEIPADFVIQESEVSLWTKDMNEWKNKELTSPIIDLLKNGQRKQAKLALAKYLTKFPNNMQAMEFAGTLLMEDKDYTSAIDAFVRVLKKHPGHNNVRTKLGVSLILLGEHVKGERVLHQVLSQTPNNQLALVYISWLSQKEGDSKKAKDYLQRLIQLSDKNKLSKFHLALARIFFQERQYIECIELLGNPSLSGQPNSLNLYHANVLLANSYFYLGETSKAKSKVEELNKKYSDEVNVHFLNALLSRRTGNYSKAIEIYEKIVMETPIRANDAKQEIAKTYVFMNKPEKAINVLEQVASSVRIEQVPPLVRDMLASLASAKLYDKAVILTEKYAIKFPDSAEINYLKAEALFLQGKKSDAIAYLKKLMFKYPKYLQNYILASHITSDKSLIEAEEFLKSAVDNNPKSTKAWVELANLYFRHNSLSKAELILSDAVKINNADKILLFELAAVKDELEKTEEANSLYRKVIAEDSTHIAALHNLLSNLAESKKGHKEALTIGEFIFSKGMSDPFVLDAYGKVLLESGDLQKASTVLSIAEENITSELLMNDKAGVSILYFHLGKTKQMSGNSMEAKKYFEKAQKVGLSDKYVLEIQKM